MWRRFRTWPRLKDDVLRNSFRRGQNPSRMEQSSLRWKCISGCVVHLLEHLFFGSSVVPRHVNAGGRKGVTEGEKNWVRQAAGLSDVAWPSQSGYLGSCSRKWDQRRTPCGCEKLNLKGSVRRQDPCASETYLAALAPSSEPTRDKRIV